MAPPAQPPRRDGEFYVIPECLARYDGLDSLQNAVPDGALAGWTLGLGAGVTVVAADAAGLPAYAGLPQAGIERAVGVFRLPGGAASGILYGREHIPDAAPFSVSCLVRLTAPLEYDYTFDARGVLNPDIFNEIGITAASAGEVAMAVTTAAEKWRAFGRLVERARLAGKKAVSEATDPAGVLAARDGIVWPQCGAPSLSSAAK